MGERGYSIRTEPTKQRWEESDFPIICAKCLGQNPYIRMMKTNFDRSCRVCDRPFTVFRWRPGPKERFKKTEICQTCAIFKKVCQSCLTDIETGETLETRDKEISLEDKFGAPTDIVNKEYWAQYRTDQVNRMKEEAKKAAEEGRSLMRPAPPSLEQQEDTNIN